MIIHCKQVNVKINVEVLSIQSYCCGHVAVHLLVLMQILMSVHAVVAQLS